LTPVHAIEISKEYFDKFLADGQDVALCLREKDKMRRQNRAKGILTLQKSLKEMSIGKGEYVYRQGEPGSELFIVEDGVLDVTVDDQTVFKVGKGELCGEYSLVFGNRPRNTSAKCTSNQCKLLAMDAKDFKRLIRANPSVREGLHETALRRQFQKALVFATKKPFPTREEELREAFVSVDYNHSGQIDLSDVALMLRNMDSTFTNKDIALILNSLDLDDDGSISWDEFKRIFGMNGTRYSNRY
jgi:CRP-like cAMP-binding protein